MLLTVNLSSGLVLRRWPAKEWLSAVIICANNATITAIMAYSGGRESNLWVLYLLPIYTACLLLHGREVIWITIGTISFNAAYYIFSIYIWDASAYFELLLKSGIFIFSAAITYRIGQRDKNSRTALENQSEELKKSQENLRQSQKIEAIGRLAGGIAHDFNNLLTVILSSTHLLLESIPEGDPKFSDVKEIKSAGLRAAALTQQLLAFSRRQTLQPKVLDLNVVINSMEGLLRRLIPENISINIDLDGNLHPIKVDPGQTEQVIMNLIVNAQDAMPQGGTIEIKTTNKTLAKPEIYLNSEIPQGRYVILSISDTGTGMNDETLSHIFEPFFTTKDVGRGTGLGLATAYGIIKQSEGYVVVSSRLGEGTTFKIHFPRAKESLDLAPRLSPDIPTLNGSETILLAEDEEQIRSLIQRVLIRHGYRVLTAENGEEALKIADQYAGAIQLLISDVIMPECGGPELLRRLKPMRPETQIIFMSGYTDQTSLENRAIRSDFPFVAKPFMPEALLRKVRDVLDS